MSYREITKEKQLEEWKRKRKAKKEWEIKYKKKNENSFEGKSNKFMGNLGFWIFVILFIMFLLSFLIPLLLLPFY
jgi:uncharacterized membrane protein